MFSSKYPLKTDYALLINGQWTDRSQAPCFAQALDVARVRAFGMAKTPAAQGIRFWYGCNLTDKDLATSYLDSLIKDTEWGFTDHKYDGKQVFFEFAEMPTRYEWTKMFALGASIRYMNEYGAFWPLYAEWREFMPVSHAMFCAQLQTAMWTQHKVYPMCRLVTLKDWSFQKFVDNIPKKNTGAVGIWKYMLDTPWFQKPEFYTFFDGHTISKDMYQKLLASEVQYERTTNTYGNTLLRVVS